MAEWPDLQNASKETNKKILSDIDKLITGGSKIFGQFSMNAKANKKKKERAKLEAEKRNPTITQELRNNTHGFVFGAKNNGYPV